LIAAKMMAPGSDTEAIIRLIPTCSYAAMNIAAQPFVQSQTPAALHRPGLQRHANQIFDGMLGTLNWLSDWLPSQPLPYPFRSFRQ
jgi:hypothetical protein